MVAEAPGLGASAETGAGGRIAGGWPVAPGVAFGVFLCCADGDPAALTEPLGDADGGIGRFAS